MNLIDSEIYRHTRFCPFWKRCQKGTRCPRVLRQDEYDSIKFNHVVGFIKERPECFRRKKRNVK